MSEDYYFKKIFYLLTVVMGAVLSLSLSGCKELSIGIEKVEQGNIVFVDFINATKIRGGNEGLIDFGGKTIGMGEKDVQILRIKNSGAGNLAINNMFFRGEMFNFVEGINPDFPITIPPGKTIDIYLEFNPQKGGEEKGQFFIDTGSAIHDFDLVGIGLWVLTISIPNTGADSNCTIESPGTINPGETKVFTSETGVFTLKCVPDMLYEFVQWTIDGTPDASPVFENVNAKETTVVLYSHTSIHATINSPFVRVPDDEANINTAISTASSAGQSVVIRAGTYDVNYDINLLPGVPVYGGYNTTGTPWTERNYKTAADRTDSTYATIINFTDTTSNIKSGAGINNDVVFEGFTVQRSSGSSTPLISLTSDTKTVVRYNTLLGNGAGAAVEFNGASALISDNVITGGTGAAVYITNYSSPRVENNTITGGTNSTDYELTYGIKISENSNPVIYKNTVSGGTSSGTGGQAYGISADFECEPEIIGNTISGGSATGNDSKTYGIYLINNGNGTIGYNDINGSNGKSMAFAVYVAYGGNLYLDYNNIYTTGGSDRYGIYIAQGGRVRRLLNNGMYDASTALVFDFFNGSFDTIDDVNNYFRTDTNLGYRIDITIPVY